MSKENNFDPIVLWEIKKQLSYRKNKPLLLHELESLNKMMMTDVESSGNIDFKFPNDVGCKVPFYVWSFCPPIYDSLIRLTQNGSIVLKSFFIESPVELTLKQYPKRTLLTDVKLAGLANEYMMLLSVDLGKDIERLPYEEDLRLARQKQRQEAVEPFLKYYKELPRLNGQESSKIKSAKKILHGWLEGGLDSEHFDINGGDGEPIYYRSYNIYGNYPIVCNPEMPEMSIWETVECLWDETGIGEDPPSHEWCIDHGYRVYTVLDVAVSHKGGLKYGFVINSNFSTDENIELLGLIVDQVRLNHPKIYKMDADWILNQSIKPKRLECIRQII